MYVGLAYYTLYYNNQKWGVGTCHGCLQTHTMKLPPSPKYPAWSCGKWLTHTFKKKHKDREPKKYLAEPGGEIISNNTRRVGSERREETACCIPTRDFCFLLFCFLYSSIAYDWWGGLISTGAYWENVVTWVPSPNPMTKKTSSQKLSSDLHINIFVMHMAALTHTCTHMQQ